MWVEKYDDIPIICYPQDINLLYTNTYINNLSIKTRIPWRIIRLFVRSYDIRKWKLFDEVISHSKFTAQNIQKHYGITAPIMYLGTNTKVFSPNSNNNKKNAILTLGDTKIRRADLLIKAASKLRKKRNDFEIWIVGSKNEIDLELKNLVKTLHIEENIKFFGQISDSKLSKLYSEALVTAHLVKEAPFGLIVIESMSCGTPVISWKPGGPEETIIHGETGFLIPENNESVLIEKIEMFLDSPDLSNKMGKKSRERVEKYFDLAQHHSHMREHLQNWINKKTRE
jgi:glycosyltransferase involved in cell wall biosynthesis